MSELTLVRGLRRGRDGGAPGGGRTHTGTLLRGLPLPVGLRGRSGESRAAALGVVRPHAGRLIAVPVRTAMIGPRWTRAFGDRPQRTHRNDDHRNRIDAPARPDAATGGASSRLSAALGHLSGAVATAADPPPVTGVALVRDPGAQLSGTAAAEAASVALTRLTGVHQDQSPSGSSGSITTGRDQCDRRYSNPADRAAARSTSSSIAGVRRPVKVFCWLTW
jgi:hypothetical protein